MEEREEGRERRGGGREEGERGRREGGEGGMEVSREGKREGGMEGSARKEGENVIMIHCIVLDRLRTMSANLMGHQGSM